MAAVALTLFLVWAADLPLVCGPPKTADGLVKHGQRKVFLGHREYHFILKMLILHVIRKSIEKETYQNIA